MEHFQVIVTIAFIHLLAAITPGPDFVMSVRNSLTYSRRTGIFTAMGFSLGIAVHVSYSIAGIAVIIARSLTLFTMIRYVGAAYLLYIGIRSIYARSHIEVPHEKAARDISAMRAIRMGFLTNILNPNATLFILGLFTIVIEPGTPRSIMIVAGAIMVIQTFLWFSFVSVFLNEKHVRSFVDRFQGYFNMIFGGLLILLAIRIALFPS